jgi:hypothetical protein
MNDQTKRLFMFLFGCIGTRLLFVYAAKNVNNVNLAKLGYAAFLVSTGLLYFYFSGTRTTGPEVLGGKIWWNNLRPVHATLYALFGLNAINGNRRAWIILLIDVIVGLTGFVYNRLTSNDK